MSKTVPIDETGEPAEISDLRDHPGVYDVRDVSVDGVTTFSVQFDTSTLPQQLLDSDEFRVRDVWIGTVPPWYLRKIISDDALMKRGIGRPGVAALLEVDK